MKKYICLSVIFLTALIFLISPAFCAESKEIDFPKISVYYSQSENMHKLAKIPGYEVFEWDDAGSNWMLSNIEGDIDIGFVIEDQRRFLDFYIISAFTGAHSSNTIVIAPKVKKIFCFSSGTPVTYFNYDAYAKNKIFEVVAVINDYKPSYVAGTEYTLKWRWNKDTFVLASAVKNKK